MFLRTTALPREKSAVFVPVVERLEARLALSTFGGAFEPRHDFGGHGDFGMPPHHRDGLLPPHPAEYRFEPAPYRLPSPPPPPIQYVVVTTTPVASIVSSPPPTVMVQNSSSITNSGVLPLSRPETFGQPSTLRQSSSVRQDRTFQPSAISARAVDDILVATSNSFVAGDHSQPNSANDRSDTNGKQSDRSSKAESSEHLDRHAIERTEQRKRVRLSLADDGDDSWQDGLPDLYSEFGKMARDARDIELAGEAVTSTNPWRPAVPLNWFYLQPAAIDRRQGGSDDGALTDDPADELVELIALGSMLPTQEILPTSGNVGAIAFAGGSDAVFEANVGRYSSFEILHADELREQIPVPVASAVATVRNDLDDPASRE